LVHEKEILKRIYKSINENDKITYKKVGAGLFSGFNINNLNPLHVRLEVFKKLFDEIYSILNKKKEKKK